MKKIALLNVIAILFTIFQSVSAEYQTIYAHGIVDGPAQMNRFKEAIATDQVKAIAFPDTESETGYGINRLISAISTFCGKPVNRSKMFMGQDQDISTINQSVDESGLSQKTIFYGCSRGAAALINYIAQHNPTSAAALVLDATPCNMPQTTHQALAKLGLHHSWDESIFTTLFPAYPAHALSPIDAIKDIENKDLPVLLLHSRTDAKVPFAHSLRLYQEFKKHGFNNIHFKDMPHGRHSFLLQDPTVKDEYLHTVHSFYKKYELPHNHDYATNVMNPYNYDFDQATQEIMSYEQALQESYEFNWYRNAIIAVAATALSAYRYS